MLLLPKLGGSQLSITPTPTPEGSTPSSGLCRQLHSCANADTQVHTHTHTHKRVRQCKSGNPYTHLTNHNGKQVGLVLHNHKHREETFHFSVLTHTRWKPDSLHICIQIHITDFFERGSHCISLINLLYRADLAQIHGDSSATASWELRVNVCATN